LPSRLSLCSLCVGLSHEGALCGSLLRENRANCEFFAEHVGLSRGDWSDMAERKSEGRRVAHRARTEHGSK
jgi:hypothetical protein